MGDNATRQSVQVCRKGRSGRKATCMKCVATTEVAAGASSVAAGLQRRRRAPRASRPHRLLPNPHPPALLPGRRGMRRRAPGLGAVRAARAVDRLVGHEGVVVGGRDGVLHLEGLGLAVDVRDGAHEAERGRHTGWSGGCSPGGAGPTHGAAQGQLAGEQQGRRTGWSGACSPGGAGRCTGRLAGEQQGRRMHMRCGDGRHEQRGGRGGGGALVGGGEVVD